MDPIIEQSTPQSSSDSSGAYQHFKRGSTRQDSFRNEGTAKPTLLVHGRLMKRDRTFHTWRWRNCYLKQGNFQIFSDKGNMKSTIDFMDSNNPLVIKLSKDPKPFGFILTWGGSHGEKIHLCAESRDDRVKWVQGFTQQCRNVIIEEEFVAITTEEDQKKEKKVQAKVGISKSQFHTGNMSSNDTQLKSQKGLPVSENASYGSLREDFSRITFPSRLSNGDLLCGVGPIVRKVRWVTEHIFSVALYIDTDTAKKCLIDYNTATIQSLQNDQNFYTLFTHGMFRKTFVFSVHKRVARSVIMTCLEEEIRPRLISSSQALDEVLEFVDKSLRRGDSMVMTCNPDDTFEFRYRGVSYPPVSSHDLCMSVQGMLFDEHSIQHEAKVGLIARIPSLYGHPEQSQNVRAAAADPKAILGIEEEELETLPPKSTNFIVDYGSIIEAKSQDCFKGYIINGSSDRLVLLGCWSKADMKVADGDILYAVGLYAEPQGLIEALLRYKGLSLLGLLSDPQFFVRFLGGCFCRSLVVRKASSIPASRFGKIFCDDIMSVSSHISSISNDLESFMRVLRGHSELIDKQTELVFAISPEGSVNLSLDGVNHSIISLTPAFGNALQNLFYGYRATNPDSRNHLLQRAPGILDQAKDDSVHTYFDEVEMMMENYKRRKPGMKTKVGYMFIFVGKRKGTKKWSKRWCRLDGVMFSYFTHKYKKKAREIIDLTRCTISDCTKCDDRFLDVQKQLMPHSTILIQKESGEEVVMLNENIYEGADWLELLLEVSRLKTKVATSYTPSCAVIPLTCKDMAEEGSLIRWILADWRHLSITVLVSLVVVLASQSRGWIWLIWEN